MAFGGCTNLTGVYFQGNSPAVGSSVFYGDPATAYYLPELRAGGPRLPGFRRRSCELMFTINNGAITITEFIVSGGAVTVPDTINGLLVTRIGDEAFRNSEGVTSVTIGSSVTNIGFDSFQCRRKLDGNYGGFA